MGGGRGGLGGFHGDGQRPDWGGEHTLQCTDDVLWSCVPETCIILLTSVIILLTNVYPINSIKRKNKKIIKKYFF